MKILTVRLTNKFGVEYEMTYTGIYDVLQHLEQLMQDNDKVVVLGVWDV